MPFRTPLMAAALAGTSFVAPLACGGSKALPPPATVTIASASAPAASARAASAPPAGTSIKRVSATEFEVERAAIDDLLENQQGSMSAARVVPETENGKTVGMRMFGIRPDSVLGRLGFENGDRLEKIDGIDVTIPEKALEVYARRRTAERVTVTLTRKGQPVSLIYTLK